ncbi:MAG TPA: 2-hydroxy-3-keto-5-methylthiopentenyl-1-phosphate phosphatase, partial [bacterium]|nr:2-hydroxy-3-keto-5-methylthiopentenyl-1-phosphate phosphatase [bacterium]
DKIQVEFPLYRKECERDMAHCKCQHVLPVQGLRRVYIGDGVSDTCAASKCDFVYAKRDLLEFCLKNRMAHCPFEDFQRIIERETEWFEQARAGAREGS